MIHVVDMYPMLAKLAGFISDVQKLATQPGKKPALSAMCKNSLLNPARTTTFLLHFRGRFHRGYSRNWKRAALRCKTGSRRDRLNSSKGATSRGSIRLRGNDRNVA